MNRFINSFSLILLIGTMAFASSEDKRMLPSVEVKTLDGKTFNTKDISNDGKPIIISFWATWCKPCVQELSTIHDVYNDWQSETGVKLIAISVDNSRTSVNVNPLVNGKEWDYEVYLDENGDFKRAMGVNMVPHTFVLNGKGEIVWQHTTFSEGGELKLIEVVRKVAKGEEITEE
ncbi:MAG: alkyl hydroperoxide reductase [Bacteroidetes bacterium CG2_30_33_31]|nr:MAG: alkyl hydroperoxide reductase [Bacteroidetes bacterium CG2_30_33_31]